MKIIQELVVNRKKVLLDNILKANVSTAIGSDKVQHMGLTYMFERYEKSLPVLTVSRSADLFDLNHDEVEEAFHRCETGSKKPTKVCHTRKKGYVDDYLLDLVLLDLVLLDLVLLDLVLMDMVILLDMVIPPQ